MALIRTFVLSVLVLTMVFNVNSSIDSEDSFKVDVQYIENVEESLPSETSYEKFEKADIDCLIWDKKCTKMLASIKSEYIYSNQNNIIVDSNNQSILKYSYTNVTTVIFIGFMVIPLIQIT